MSKIKNWNNYSGNGEDGRSSGTPRFKEWTSEFERNERKKKRKPWKKRRRRGGDFD